MSYKIWADSSDDGKLVLSNNCDTTPFETSVAGEDDITAYAILIGYAANGKIFNTWKIRVTAESVYGSSSAPGVPINLYALTTDVAGRSCELPINIPDETTDLTVADGKLTFRMPYAMTLTEVRASVNTAPTDADIIVDVTDGGTSIFSTLLTIDATEKTSTTAEVPAVISDTALASGAEVSVNIDQIGSTIAGAGLKLWLIGTRA